MSNRIERTQDKKSVERNQRILKDLLALPANKVCADCKKRDPRWASANLGIFICLRCSGVHRSLGVHISKVRSVDLDTWIPEHMETMQRWGNARANRYWEHGLPADHAPEDARVESFIRQKYEYKKFVRPGPMPEPETLDGVQTTAAPAAVAPVAAKVAPVATTTAVPQSWHQGPPPQHAPPPAPTGWDAFATPPTMAAPSAPGVQFAAAFGAQPVPQATNRNADIMSLFQQAPPVAAMQQQQQHFQKAAMHQQQQFNQFQQPQQFSAGFGAFAQQQQPAASSGFGAFQQPQQQQQPMRPVQQQQQPPQPFANTNAGGWGAFQ